MFKRLSIVAAAVALAATAAGTANVRPAAAHDAGALYKHGWLVSNPSHCSPSFPMFGYTVPGDVNVKLPDLVTTPLTRNGTTYLSKYVYFTAQLEQYDFNAKAFVVTEESRSRPKPWVRAIATSQGLMSNWHEFDSYGNATRWAGSLTFSWSVAPGFYRVRFYVLWGIDGTFFNETTAWCQVT